jgi:hypothetical protein
LFQIIPYCSILFHIVPNYSILIPYCSIWSHVKWTTAPKVSSPSHSGNIWSHSGNIWSRSGNVWAHSKSISFPYF